MKTLSINDKAVETPNEIYVLLNSNLEYNDHTYDAFGEFLNSGKFYTSKNEALQKWLPFLKIAYGNLRIYEIYELLKFDDAGFLHAVVTSSGVFNAQECEMTIEETIEVLQEYYSVDELFLYDVFKDFLRIAKIEKQ